MKRNLHLADCSRCTIRLWAGGHAGIKRGGAWLGDAVPQCHGLLKNVVWGLVISLHVYLTISTPPKGNGNMAGPWVIMWLWLWLWLW